jgi:hypothetical protein
VGTGEGTFFITPLRDVNSYICPYNKVSYLLENLIKMSLPFATHEYAWIIFYGLYETILSSYHKTIHKYVYQLNTSQALFGSYPN